MLYKTLVLDEERISRQPLISARRDTADNGPGRWGWQSRTSSEPAWKIPTPDDGPRKNCPPRREKERKKERLQYLLNGGSKTSDVPTARIRPVASALPLERNAHALFAFKPS